MSESNPGVNVKLVIKFEKEFKSLISDIAEDSKKILSLADFSYAALKDEAEKRFSEIQSTIDNDKKAILDDMRKEYALDREKKILAIKSAGEKNLNKAVDMLLDSVLGAFK